MPNEADTCRKLVVPKLQAAGWDNEPHSIAEQRWFTPGRIVVHGNQATRRRGKRANPSSRSSTARALMLMTWSVAANSRWIS